MFPRELRCKLNCMPPWQNQYELLPADALQLWHCFRWSPAGAEMGIRNCAGPLAPGSCASLGTRPRGSLAG